MQIQEEMREHERPCASFNFHYMPDAKFNSVGNPAVQPLLDKWGFQRDMSMSTFRVEERITSEDIPALLDAFFKDRGVVAALHSNTRLRLGSPPKTRVHWEPVSTKAVSMSFLNKFQDCGAISDTGHIQGCIEEYFDEICINNLIREVVLVEDSDMYDSFSEKDRKELLFKIFTALVFGGASNQYEDHVEDYFKVTKEIYKDLLTVRRNDAGDVEVLSTVCQINSLGEGGALFPKENPLNFCYIIYDPLMRHIRVWYFGYRPFW